jgi:hypothetical protein
MPKTLSRTIIYIGNEGVVTGGEWVALLQLRKRRESPRDKNRNMNMIFAPSIYIASNSKHIDKHSLAYNYSPIFYAAHLSLIGDQ